MNAHTTAEVGSNGAELADSAVGDTAILCHIGMRTYFHIMQEVWWINACISGYQTISLLRFRQRIATSLTLRYDGRIEDIAQQFLKIVFEFHDNLI